MSLVKVSELIVSEPLSAATEARGRKLVISSCAAILISVYGLQVKSTAWLELDVPSGAPNVLTGVLSVVVCYYFLAFSFFVYADITRWLASSRIVNLHAYWDLAARVRSDVHSLAKSAEKPYIGPQAMKALTESSVATASFCNTLEAKVQEVNSYAKKLTHLQVFRIVSFDVGIPVTLGLFATIKLWPAFWPFVRALFQ